MDMNSIHAELGQPSMIANKEAGKTEGQVKKKESGPREKYVLGTSGCYYEPADYIKSLFGTTDTEKAQLVTDLFANPLSTIEVTIGGRSLKVMFEMGNEIKYCGFITHGDGKMKLTENHIDAITKHVTTEEIYRACTAQELVNAFRMPAPEEHAVAS